ncbi:aminopeptidase NAALADL1 isoform X1 [Homo sapiens]|uniref:aminopeptidase NAALADL1 isoform X1 n=1 Tax=Homo sapiens TaxID=9606 RepID=UPI0005D006A3|nr:aminopeptidase NAALADL1 isoform X1 [Homo sapiens]XP_054223322.1 aminopeptidase NAALADL1 isoform X1 [Homo sapiens]|eukprot:XP_011543008.1 N-acetylated-alpha-linked acidic dipeptidase-like protein isoform X1 [Homo sapiens]
MQWTKVLGLGLGAAALLGLGIILGHFAIPKKANSLAPQDLDLEILETVMGQLDAHRIRENLRELSREPHLASSPRDEDLVQLLLQRWKDPESGLDSAEASTYEVLLSFPSQEQPNVVDIVGPTGGIIHSCHRTEENVTGEQGGPDVVQPYAAYAPSGTPQGLLVYANRGAEEDFKELQTQGIKLEGTIALTRYGGVGRGAKAVNAAKHGVAGVLVYTDPADINDGLSSPDETFPNSWYLPPSGVERGSYYEYFGDPLTPYLPAVPSSFRVDLANVSGFPPIPTQPIGFQDARDLLCNLNGTLAPATWQGALGCHYRLGPGFRPDGDFPADSQVNVSVYNRLELRNSSNVLGIIRGAVEPDRYVLYGNHRDSWVHGAVDPSSGTAVLLELSRVLGTLLKKGTWRPRRSIVFASWGAEEFGLIGSTEFTEEFFNKLQERTVAYINVDISVFANATLRVQGTPPVQSVVFSATKEIRSPGPGDLSIYDNWIRYFNRSSPVYGLVPRARLQPGSTPPTTQPLTPLTMWTSFWTRVRRETRGILRPGQERLKTEPWPCHLAAGFSSHQAVARTAGSVILRLSDSFFLPLKVSDYSETLRSFLQAAQQDLGALLEQHSISLGPLVTAVEKFEAEAAALGQRISTLQKGSPDPLQVRMLNDQLMLLERTFLNPRAFPEERYYSHVLWAPRTGSVVTFPGLSNACSRARDTASGSEAWAEVQRQLSIVVTALEGAAATLRPVADL